MLHVVGLGCARGGAAVLNNVSFDLAAGQALVLRGPNGIGKTTLLRTLAGLQPPITGDVVMPEEAAAYASHADGIKTALTVTENLAFWAEVYGMPLDLAVLDRFDLAATVRASFGLYNAREEVDVLVKGIKRVQEMFA